MVAIPLFPLDDVESMAACLLAASDGTTWRAGLEKLRHSPRTTVGWKIIAARAIDHMAYLSRRPLASRPMPDFYHWLGAAAEEAAP